MATRTRRRGLDSHDPIDLTSTNSVPDIVDLTADSDLVIHIPGAGRLLDQNASDLSRGRPMSASKPLRSSKEQSRKRNLEHVRSGNIAVLSINDEEDVNARQGRLQPIDNSNNQYGLPILGQPKRRPAAKPATKLAQGANARGNEEELSCASVTVSSPHGERNTGESESRSTESATNMPRRTRISLVPVNTPSKAASPALSESNHVSRVATPRARSLCTSAVLQNQPATSATVGGAPTSTQQRPAQLLGYSTRSTPKDGLDVSQLDPERPWIATIVSPTPKTAKQTNESRIFGLDNLSVAPVEERDTRSRLMAEQKFTTPVGEREAPLRSNGVPSASSKTKYAQEAHLVSSVTTENTSATSTMYGTRTPPIDSDAPRSHRRAVKSARSYQTNLDSTAKSIKKQNGPSIENLVQEQLAQEQLLQEITTTPFESVGAKNLTLADTERPSPSTNAEITYQKPVELSKDKEYDNRRTCVADETLRQDEKPAGPTSHPVTSGPVRRPPLKPQASDTALVETKEDISGQALIVPIDINADDLASARSAIQTCLKSHVLSRREQHAYYTASILWRQRTGLEREVRARTRPSSDHARQTYLPQRYIQATSPFANMGKQQVSPGKSLHRQTQRTFTVITKGSSKDQISKTSWTAPVTLHRSETVDVPSFKEYVSLKTSVLADNVSKLSFTPYHAGELEEEAVNDVLAYREKLCLFYEMERENNNNLDLRREQTRFYEHSVHEFLNEVGICWDDILFWLLAPEKKLQTLNAGRNSRDFDALLLTRATYQKEKFLRAGEEHEATLFNPQDKRWAQYLDSRQSEPDYTTLRLAALACASFYDECKFSIWYLAQQSDALRSFLSKGISRTDVSQRQDYAFRDTACRICHIHNCAAHGEIRQEPAESRLHDSDDSEDDSSDDTLLLPAHQISDTDDDDDDDSDDPDQGPDDLEKVINYKTLVNATGSHEHNIPDIMARKKSKPPVGGFKPKWWERNSSNTMKWEKRNPFVPCNHEGPCEVAHCRCYAEGVTCEKYCKCDRMCNRRFPGCRSTCASVKTCSPSICLCRLFRRECDADLCTTCGATEILDPINRYNEAIHAGHCSNVAIQRRVPRRTLMGHSELHGFGLYAGEDLKEDDYIGEYIGEIISAEEAMRREIIYESQKTMYLFSLNKRQEVDATSMGNKLRFINNADDDHANCVPRVVFCNSVFRIALFAKVDIKAGMELFFNYNYSPEITAGFKQPQLVAVKTKKPTAKPKSSTIHEMNPTVDRSKIFAATAKARAAKAEKAARLKAELTAQSQSQGSSMTPASSMKKARKSSNSTTIHPSQTSQTSQRSGRQGAHNQRADYSFKHRRRVAMDTQDTQSTQSSRVIQETDSEDNDFFPEDTQEAALKTAVHYREPIIEDSEEDEPQRRRRGRPRVATNSVFAVKQTRGGGMRAGAGRPKRKRPLVEASDDE